MVEAWLQDHVSQLVTAVGVSTKNGYTLGTEAQGCLSDLKKWLINYDSKMNKWDVARAIANTTLVDGDLLTMIETHATNPEEVPFKSALNALEILTHLTWPLEPDRTNINHMSHISSLSSAQIRYKRAALGRKSLFKGVIKLTLPSLGKPKNERKSKDQGIIRLCINFVRNLLAIERQDRSELLVALDEQKMLEFIVLVISNEESYSAQHALPFLEVLWGMVSNVDAAKLFKGSSEFTSKNKSLSELLAKEKKMSTSRFKPTRHSRFGTMISLDMGDSALPVSGQQALSENYFESIDKSKTWRKAKVNTRKEKYQWNLETSLTPRGQEALKGFVNGFLDSAYNPFFGSARRFASGLSDDFSAEQIMHYVYLVGWFANAERMRGKEVDFKLIGTALSYHMFSLVCDIMANAHEPGPGQSFDLVHASMACLRAILMAIDDMTRASTEWKDAAENILARLFYDDQRLDLFARLPRNAVKRTVAYQAETIELIHSLFKLLDFYASDKAYLFVKSRRREADRDDEDAERSQAKVKDRKWDLGRYIRSFYHESTLELYEKTVENFEDSDDKVLKHCLAFYSRLFIKRELRANFYKLSFMMTLHRATSSRGIENPELLKSYTKFTSFYTKHLFKAFEEHPSLYFEILFNKSRQDIEYYDQGIVDKAPKRSKASASFDYELPDSLSPERKIAVTVAALVEDDRKSIVEWVLETLKTFVETNSKVRVFCESPGRLREINSIPLLRLLLKLIGIKFEKGRYFIPSAVDSLQLIEACEWIQRYLGEQLNEDPHNHLKRVVDSHEEEDDELFVPRANPEEESETEDGFNDPRLQPLSSEELAAKALLKKKSSVSKKPPQTRKRVSVDDSSSDESEPDGVEEVPRKRTAPEKEKNFLSSAFVHASDDEEDEERDRLFFQRELEQRRRVAAQLEDENQGQIQVDEEEDLFIVQDPAKAPIATRIAAENDSETPLVSEDDELSTNI